MTPLTTFLVVWGFGDTIDIFSPVILFSRVDLPEFGLPGVRPSDYGYEA